MQGDYTNVENKTIIPSMQEMYEIDQIRSFSELFSESNKLRYF